MPSTVFEQQAPRPFAPLDPSPRSLRRLRSLSTANLLRMGHCAPCIMKTILDASQARADWLVKLAAGMPGGIGNTGGECGGVTSPLVLMGLRYRAEARDGLPVVVDKGQEFLRLFASTNRTLLCRKIRGDSRLPLQCVRVIRQTPALYVRTLSDGGVGTVSGERREAYRRLHAHHVEQRFHCSHEVFRHLRRTIPVSQDLLDGTSAFTGGTVYEGLTCSALAAGVMALGLALGEIEHSRLRVLRMIGVMAAGGDAAAEDLNACNRTMNLGHRLAEWFEGEFGAIECRAITQCDFATISGVTSYVEGGGVARCRTIARQVAAKVRDQIDHSKGGHRAH